MKHILANVVAIISTLGFSSGTVWDGCSKGQPNKYFFASGKFCCNGQILPTSNITSFHPDLMKECSTSINNGAGYLSADGIYEHFWKLYECVVKKSINYGDSALTMKEFAKNIAANYPEDIKTKILETITQVGFSIDETIQGSERLKRIRGFYYDIEEQINLFCTQMFMLTLRIDIKNPFQSRVYYSGEICTDVKALTMWSISELRSCSNNAQNSIEIIRGLGMCCNNKTVPVHILYAGGHPSGQQNEECLKDLINSVGTLKEGAIGKLQKLFAYPCRYIALGLVTKEELSKPVDYEALITKMLPNFLGEIPKNQIYKSVIVYMKLNGTSDDYASSPDADLIPIIEKALPDQVNKIFQEVVQESPDETASKAIIASSVIQKWIHTFVIFTAREKCHNPYM